MRHGIEVAETQQEPVVNSVRERQELKKQPGLQTRGCLFQV